MMDEQLQRALVDAMRRTWNVIAHDIFEANGDGEPLPAKDVRELVLDASHVDSYGGLNAAGKKAFSELSWKEKDRLALLAFPSGRYGP